MPLYRFAILNAMSGGLIVVAPIVFGIANYRQGTTKERQTGLPKDQAMVAPAWGVLLAALITAFGVGTELAFLGVLIQLSAASSGWRDALVALPIGASALLLAYAVITTRALFLTSWRATLESNSSRESRPRWRRSEKLRSRCSDARVRRRASRWRGTEDRWPNKSQAGAVGWTVDGLSSVVSS